MIGSFTIAINKRFGREMKFTRLTVEGAWMRQTSLVLRAAVADKVYKLAKEQERERMRMSRIVRQLTTSGRPLTNSHMAISRAVAAVASIAFLCKPNDQCGVHAYHGTAFKFQNPDSDEVWMGTAAHCLKKCAAYQKYRSCVKPGLLYRLVPSLPADGSKFKDFIDCEKC